MGTGREVSTVGAVVVAVVISLLTASPALAAEPVGPGVYENDNTAIEYFGTWTTQASSKDSGGSHNNSTSASASASLTFIGTAVSWLSRKTPTGGINDVYIDDALVDTVDRYDAAGTFQQTLYTAEGLAGGTHTITIKATGRKNGAATGSTTVVDAFVVPQPTSVSGLAVNLKAEGPELSWRASTGADAYVVYRAGDGEPVRITDSPVTGQSFTDTGAQAATRYAYTVRALAGGQEGPPSDPVSVVTAAGPGVYENDHPALAYEGTWTTVSSENDSGGSFSSSNSSTAKVSFAFTGTSVSWVSRQTGASGINDVLIDGSKVATVDRYNAVGAYRQTVFSTDSLSQGPHTISILATGTKNSSASGSQTIVDSFVVPDTRIVKDLKAEPAGNTISLQWAPVSNATAYNVYRQPDGQGNESQMGRVNADPVLEAVFTDAAASPSVPYSYSVAAIIDGEEAPRSETAAATAAAGVGTYENAHPAISYSGTWKTTSSSNDSGGSYAQSTSPTATASFTFSGPAIQWISRKTGASGINDVYIDGAKVATVDRYSASGQFQQVVYQTATLSNATHTITVKATGKKNTAASGSITILDAFVVPDTRIPKNPIASATTSGISVSWSSVSSARSYNVYRSQPGSSAVKVNSGLVTGTSFSDNTTSPATAYTYTVKAVVDGTEGPASVPVQVVSAAVPGTYENDHQAIRYSGTWSTNSSSNDSGGSYATSNSATASASFTFVGSNVVWVSRMTGASGINEVLIDGKLVATVDRYSATGKYQVQVHRATGLSDGVHTLTIRATGKKNSAATGSSVIVDSIRVPQPSAPTKVASVKATNEANGVNLSWKPSSDSDTVAYNIYRGTSTSGELSRIATVPASQSSFLNVDVKGTRTYRYYVRAVDYIDRTSATWASVTARVTAYAGSEFAGISDCPAATVTATSTSSLEAALANAKPGDVIRLRDGVYNKRFAITVRGTATSPVWICGSAKAVLKGYGISGGNGFEIKNSSYVVLSGVTVTESLKAVMVTRSDHVTVSNVTAHTTGQEGIHLRQNTTDSVVAGNTVSNTGLVTPEYGEGIYIGNHPDNWCSQNNCDPDKSDRNLIADNTISDTAAEAIDAKEGSSNGRIVGNLIDSSGTTSADRRIVIRGNGWFVADNKGSGGSVTDDIRVDAPPLPGYGTGNIIVRNSAALSSASGYAVRVNQKGNFVGCTTNAKTGGKALTNIACVK